MTYSIIAWILAPLLFAGWAFRSFAFWRGMRGAPRLHQVSPDGPSPLPRLSVIVPALNEEATVEAAMRTLLAVDYPDIEIIAVDDRSTDRTGEVLDRIAASDPRLRVVHVRDLPAGWLGKSHALHVGSGIATGRWLLFTDADIHFDSTALARAVRFAEEGGAGHLVVLPDGIAVGFWEKVFLSFFWTLFAIQYKPWKVSDPRSDAAIGVGAFNLVRSDAYCRSGGHASMRMEILDDVKLGKRLKTTGARQMCLYSGGLVRVRWLVGLGGLIEGLTKNVFAALEFSLWRVALSLFLLFSGSIWPLIGIFTGPLVPSILCAGTMACMVIAFRCARPTPRVSSAYALGFPVAAAIFAYIILRSTWRTYAQGGVIWRGTLYPLAELRKGLV
jgi:glycosyltransferase involved in cell wall biosynthesis